MISTERGIAEHALKALRLSKNPGALKAIRAAILPALDEFLAALENQCAKAGGREELLQAARRSAENIKSKPLEWFADQHDWDKSGAVRGAGLLIKFEGNIGK